MYKSLSFYGKLLSFILLVIAMILLKNYNIFLLICGMIFILSFLNKNRLYFLLCLVLFVATYLIPFSEISFYILKIVLIVLYALIIESSLLSLEKRYLYDILFYRNSTTKQLKKCIKRYYYKDVISSIENDNVSIQKYLFDKDKYKNFLKEESKNKAEIELDNLYLIDKLRYDRYYTSKKSKLTFSWNNYDNLYMALSLILFVIVIVFGM